MSAAVTVLAWDASGNKLVKTPVMVGDEIDWKRQGRVGTVRMRVDRVWRGPDGFVQLTVSPLGGGRRRRIRRGVNRVFAPDGSRRPPATLEPSRSPYDLTPGAPKEFPGE